MRKSIIFFFFISMLIFVCCKKKDSTPPPPANSTTTGNTIIAGDYGTFLSAYEVMQFGNTFYIDSVINGHFYDAPGINPTAISAGTVSVNGTTLDLYPNPYVYLKTNQINLKTLNWQISGNGTITAVSFSYNPVHPAYTGYNMLPDTISKSSGFNFVLTGISNSNGTIYVSISQASISITRTAATSPATISLSPSDLANFIPGSDFNFRISLFNYSNITLNSKQYGINANRTFEKYIYLKP